MNSEKYHTSSTLTEDEVVGTEELTKWTSPDRIHGTGFEIDKDGTRDIFVSRCLIWLVFGTDLLLLPIHTSLK